VTIESIIGSILSYPGDDFQTLPLPARFSGPSGAQPVNLLAIRNLFQTSPEEKLLVSLSAQDWGDLQAAFLQSYGGQKFDNLLYHTIVNSGIGHYTPFTDLAARRLKLRLNERHNLASGAKPLAYCRQDHS
jgi:hypothetical protein